MIMSITRKPKQSRADIAKKLYTMDAHALNLRINKQFIEEANELSAKWKAEKLKKEKSNG